MWTAEQRREEGRVDVAKKGSVGRFGFGEGWWRIGRSEGTTSYMLEGRLLWADDKVGRRVKGRCEVGGEFPFKMIRDHTHPQLVESFAMNVPHFSAQFSNLQNQHRSRDFAPFPNLNSFSQGSTSTQGYTIPNSGFQYPTQDGVPYAPTAPPSPQGFAYSTTLIIQFIQANPAPQPHQ
ncbi:hypothetical protein RIF29_21132 [Crotalaria pallida]|uniref:Uncharacterized protein n=1 Tax=Crotalaria pallida TaxID=3830 RepID=A0AAN9I845_CROPI